jgi:hypothetical protein
VVCALLDFIYLAQFPAHSSTSVTQVDDSVARFHDNKDVFLDFGIHEHFNLPKIHSLLHYSSSIQLFGTTDNYNTEQTEHLHIDFTKDAYRATNHKDEYSQMTTWLECREKVQIHHSFVKWRQQPHEGRAPTAMPLRPLRAGAQILKISQKPAVWAASFDDLAHKYGAVDFQDALADLIAQFNNPMASGAALSALASNTLIPFCSVSVHHRFKFSNLNGTEIVDSVLARPEQKGYTWVSCPLLV